MNKMLQLGMSSKCLQSVGLMWRIVLAFSIVPLCSCLVQCQDSFAECFLQVLQFDIPDATVVIGLDTLRLRELKCNQCQIGGLQSSVVFPSNLNGELISIKLHCDGTYSYGLIHGRLSAAISISSLTLDAMISRSADGLYPASVTSSSCNVHNLDAKVRYTGGAAGKVLNVISPIVESIIKKNVESTMCSKLSQLTTVDGTNALVNQIDPTLKKLIDSGLPDPVDPAGDESLSVYVHWPTSIVAGANSLIFDQYSGRLGTCFFGNKNLTENSDGNFPVPMDKIINQYTGGTGNVVVDLGPSSIFPIPSSISLNSSIKFERVSISGLGDLTVSDAAHPSLDSNYTLSSSIYVKNIGVEVDFSFCRDTSGQITCDTTESSLIAVMKNVTIDVSCAVGALQKKLRSMHVEDLFSKTFWNSAIDYVNITSLLVQSEVYSIALSKSNTANRRTSHGILSEDLDTGIMNLINNALILCLNNYQELIQSVISASMQGPIRHIINHEISAMLKKNKPPPDTHYGQGRYLGDDFSNLQKKGDNLVINWAEFEPLQLFRNISNNVTPEDINSYIDCLMYKSNQSTSTVNAAQVSIQKNSLQLSPELSLSGLDSIYRFSPLKPFPLSVTGHIHNLLTDAGIGYCQGDDRKTLDFRYTAPSTPELKSPFTSATLSLGNFYVDFEIVSELLMGTYRSVQLDSLAKPGCALSIFQKISLESIGLGMTEAFVDVEYGNDAVNMNTLGGNQGRNQKVLDLTDAVRKVLKMIETPGSLLQMNNALSQYADYSRALCASETSASIQDNSHAQSEELQSKEHDDEKISFIVIMVCMCFGVISVFLALFLFKQHNTTLNGHNDYQAAPSTDTDIRVKETTQIDHVKLKNNSTLALCYNDQLSLPVRLSLLLLITANIALFVYSNISMDAVAVIVTLTSGTFSSLPEPVLVFGLLGTIVSMWEAKVYLLSILVAFLSGLWPYIKLFSLLACFTTPPPGSSLTQPSDQPVSSCCQHTMTLKRRDAILRAVESLGKWGLLDFYVMVLMMCAFHFNLQMQMTNKPSPSSTPLLIEVLVKPNFGFFSFLLATMLSHAISHVMLACHRHALYMDTSTPCETGATGNNDIASISTAGSPMKANANSSTALNEECYRVIDVEFLVFCGHFPQSDECISMRTYSDERTETPSPFKSAANYTKIKTTDMGKTFLLFSMMQLIMLIVGVTLLFSFSFQFEGLVGYMLENQGIGNNIVDYSFFSVGMRMQEAAGVSNDNLWRGGLRLQIVVMQICYYLFGLVAPLLLLLALIGIWYLPLTRSKLEKNLIAIDILGAWTALDVFCLSVAAALLEIRQFAAFIVGDHCQEINSFTEYFMPGPGGKSMTCFDVITTLKLVSNLHFKHLH